MADALNRFTRGTKRIFEQIYHTVTNGQRGIDEFLFNTPDDDVNSANFALDQLIVNPYAASFRNPNEQSAVRPYNPGIGNVYETPRASEKTPITEELRDAIIAGGEFFDSVMSREQNLFNRIMMQHIGAHTATRWKMAIDTMREGAFQPWGVRGIDLTASLGIDFGRDATLDDTYDFTISTHTINKALRQAWDKYRAVNGPATSLAVLMGADWLQTFEEDSTVNDYRKAQGGNGLIQSNLIPPIMQNVYGLYIVATYRVPGIPVPVVILAFNPDANFAKYRGATEEPFIPDDEMIMFSITSTRYKVRRRIDVKDDSGRATSALGDIVFDQFSEDDPVVTWLRSSARYAFVPGAVNHTYRCTGTFNLS